MLGFRVWDSSGKKMIYDIDQGYCILPDGRFTAIYPIRTGPVYVPPGKNFIPMQSTGLKDCNGTEIFEGDVVSLTFDIDPHGMGYPGKGIKTEAKLVTTVTDFLCFYGSLWPVVETKVLFNMYENPELLEKVQ